MIEKINGRNHSYDKPEYKDKLRKAKLGKNNPCWKGGVRNWKHYNPIMKSMKQQCSMCGSIEKLVTHHIDFNYKNNVLENIQVVCRGCHNKIHKTKKVIG